MGINKGSHYVNKRVGFNNSLLPDSLFKLIVPKRKKRLKKYPKDIMIRLTDGTYAKLTKFAKHFEMTRTEYVRQCVLMVLKHNASIETLDEIIKAFKKQAKKD